MSALTKRQRTALVWVERGFVNSITMRSMPSLIRRGLVEAEKKSGRLTGRYFITPVGRTELAQSSAPTL